MSSLVTDLRADFEIIFHKSHHPASVLLMSWKYHTSLPFRTVVIYRVAHLLIKKGYRLAAILLHRHLYRTLHADISPSALIGPRLRIPHPVGVVIGDCAVIGTHAVIMQGVTIGGNFSKRADGRSNPMIGNHVFIGPNVCVLGPVVIGNNVRIGANSVVTKSFGDNVTIAGAPARLLKALPLQSPPSQS